MIEFAANSAGEGSNSPRKPLCAMQRGEGRISRTRGGRQRLSVPPIFLLGGDLNHIQRIRLSCKVCVADSRIDRPEAIPMRSEMKITRKIANEFGVLSDQDRMVVEVWFDLIETQDFDEGLPTRAFSYGNLQFKREPMPDVAQRLLSMRSLHLTGAGIQVGIRLQSLDSFTVVTAIREVHQAGKQEAAA
jgi:hypothetical protein